MEIVHFSTGHTGGAGLAARRLHAGLLSAGVDSTFLALKHPRYIPGEQEIEIKRNLGQKFASGLSTFIAKEFSDQVLVTPFSLNLIDEDFLQSYVKSEHTIFHIHNWFNIFSQSSLAKLSRRFNLVLTLHDQRIFTGACHYSLDCSNFQSICSSCPKLTGPLQAWTAHKHSADLNFSGLSYITPSQWLHDLAVSSRYLCDSRGIVIPNCFFDYESFLYEGTTPPSSTINVGLAAIDAGSWIKGGEIVASLMSTRSTKSSLKFHKLSDFNETSDFWKLVDVLLVPSMADNSPNVIHEAKLWGKPVVGSRIGGIPEVLSADFDALIPLAEMTPSRIEDEILRVFFLSRDLDKRIQIARSHREFLDSSVPRHIDFYNSISIK